MILYNKEAREKLKKGVDGLADTVKVTLGPSGKNVIITRDGDMVITKDGVSVANAVFFEDEFENLGAYLLKEVAQQTNKKVGDGTTTATVLAQAILKEGFSRIEKGEDPMEITRELKDKLPAILEKLKEHSKDITKEEDIRNIAKIATNNDIDLSEIIFECYKAVKDNIIFEVSRNNTTYFEIVKGMRFRSTYISTYFINDNDSVVFDTTCSVFIYNGKIDNIKSIMPVLYAAEKEKTPLVIIAEDIDNNSLINLTRMHKQGTLPCVVLQAPGFGFGREKTLEDIAVYTGTEVYSKDNDLKSIVFGKCDSIIVDEENTTIKGSHGDELKIAARITELEHAKQDKTPYEIAKLDERIAKFKDGIGIIYIGAESEIEMRERRDRLEDAINAVKAAVEEGIVPGGGSILRFISYWNNDNIYHKVLKAPYEQILKNRGITEDDIILPDDETFSSYLKEGIIDPLKVTRTALENAVSVASTILTTEAIVI